MPTAAKLIAIIVLAITGILTAGEIKPLLPEGQPTKWLYQVCIIVPIVCGWRVVGRLIGKGYKLSINVGIYATVVASFFSVLTFAIAETLKRSTRKAYDGPMEAIVSMFGVVLEYGVLLFNPGPGLYLVVCALIVGPMAEYGHRKWG